MTSNVVPIVFEHADNQAYRLFLFIIKKKVVFLHRKKLAGTVLSLGLRAERKVRAARVTMLPNGKEISQQ